MRKSTMPMPILYIHYRHSVFIFHCLREPHCAIFNLALLALRPDPINRVSFPGPLAQVLVQADVAARAARSPGRRQDLLDLNQRLPGSGFPKIYYLTSKMKCLNVEH